MSKLIDISGQTFGRLTVEKRIGSDATGKAIWQCLCSCGGRTVASGDSLRRRNTASCGCLRFERITEANSTHKESRTRLYIIWHGMKRRCSNPKVDAFPWYGGRGIRVCEEWLRYEPFRDWARANGYAEHLTIDRINGDGHYEPANCRWATHAEQRRNQRPHGRS